MTSPCDFFSRCKVEDRVRHRKLDVSIADRLNYYCTSEASETHLFARFEDVTLESIAAPVTGNVTKDF